MDCDVKFKICRVQQCVQLSQRSHFTPAVFHVDRHLDDAKKGFTAISLSLLANYRKRQQLTALLKSLHTIKTLVRLVSFTEEICFNVANFILATICTLCEAPESNTIDSGALQISCIIIIIIMSHYYRHNVGSNVTHL